MDISGMVGREGRWVVGRHLVVSGVMRDVGVVGGKFPSFVNNGPKVRLGRCFCFLMLVGFVC